MSPEQFIKACAPFSVVSHETILRLQTYADLLVKWQAKINLVSPNTLNQIWERHIFDSAQLLDYIPLSSRVADFGSGAGFPALVLAIMGVQHVSVIESDQRKVAFLQEVARVTNTPVTFYNKRIEAVEPFAVDVLTARALASVDSLLGYFQSDNSPQSNNWLRSGTRAILLKGENVKEELTLAQAKWHIDYELKASRSDPKAAVLIINEARAQ